jgi:hypothetical protein
MSTRVRALAAAVALAGASAARGEGTDDDRVIPVASGGTIRGTCRVTEVVEPPLVRAWPGMGADRDFPSDRVALGPGRRLGGCVVSLPAVAQGQDWPEAMRAKDRVAWIEVRAGAYRPHVQLVRAGTRLAFRSRIPGDPNVHGYRGDRSKTQFNFLLAAGVEAADVDATLLEIPAVYFVTEDGRSALTAYVHALANPYADLTHATDLDGKAPGDYVLRDVPAGEHRLRAWHEGMAQEEIRVEGRFAGYRYSPDVVLERTVKVEAGRDTVVDFDFEAPPKK